MLCERYWVGVFVVPLKKQTMKVYQCISFHPYLNPKIEANFTGDNLLLQRIISEMETCKQFKHKIKQAHNIQNQFDFAMCGRGVCAA